jgi:hypothetical protein
MPKIIIINNNNNLIPQFNSVLFLFTLLNSPKANYNVSMSEERNKTNTPKQKTKQGHLHHLDNNTPISAITPIIMRRENIYMYIHTEYN